MWSLLLYTASIHTCEERIGNLREGVRQRRVMSNFDLGQCRSYDSVLKLKRKKLKLNDLILNRVHNILKLLQQSVSEISRSRRVVFTAIYLDVLPYCMIFKFNISYFNFLSKSGGGVG